MSEFILEMQGITKIFGGVKANDSINLQIKKGEIHGLLGENGAGKTTLMNILYGLYTPNSGVIKINGEPVQINNSLEAIAHSIGMVHQHFMLVPAFTVLENIVLGLPSTREPFLDLKKARTEVMELAKTHSLTIHPDMRVSDLSTGLKQQVEIIKVLYRGAKVLVLDEPTGVLTPGEMVELFHTLRSLANEGNSIIIISHKLDEIMQISDRISVLRRGKMINTVETKETTPEALAEMMVGREVVFQVEKKQAAPGPVVLEVENLCAKGAREASTLKNVNFCVHAGEIVGVAGVDGNGQSELMEVLGGLRKAESGHVRLEGEEITNLSPRQIIRKKVAFVPEDRKETGTVKGFNIDQNLILRNVDRPPVSKFGVIRYKKVHAQADEVIKDFDIRLSYRNVDADLLSGGNLQKVILARELNSKPKLLLAMHPIRGLDVGAIEFIHRQLLNARDAGTAILLVSTELDEILALSDRIIVFCDGYITGELSDKEATTERLGRFMTGSHSFKEGDTGE